MPAHAPISVPAQLPAVPADLTGRDSEIAELRGQLRRDDPAGTRATGAMPTCVVTGGSGVGKSTLALRVAHDMAVHFPDGQLYADLRGSTSTPAQAADVLGRFLRALDAGGALPECLDERAERFRTVLAGRRVLVLLDDAADEPQVRPLLPGGSYNAVVVTARRRLSGLAGATHLDLGMLAEPDAVRLLARVAGEKRVADDPLGARDIVALCGLLPLAVRIVGARLAARPHWTLASMISRLADESRRLSELAVADQQVTAGIAATYRGLGSDARTALRCLSWLGLPDFPAWIIAPLLDIPLGDADAAAEGLIDAKAIDFVRVDPLGLPRYRIHELIRVYAAQQAHQHDNRDLLTHRCGGSCSPGCGSSVS
ncbi:hypothetical protein Psuf_054640 [Phytohabitans suffuscus]|uniref:NB-ARC domain-containing protein n=1 Tax=Phytohabitans suffuscus TaxID=624315 RepID=A0A6F8YQH3_9ACTN|nr:NB-ARC domain-containing protein [Phytohabitans suffuscus]BCB88151.1 hypothetical protein Psuf_054640 [Phytohabitans suffuscus]